MREVRMTFGEHLEELRKRILWALLYVVVGVVVAIAVEKPLMEAALQPHQRAFRNAQKSKLLERLDTQLKELQAFEVPPGPPGEAAPASASPIGRCCSGARSGARPLSGSSRSPSAVLLVSLSNFCHLCPRRSA